MALAHDGSRGCIEHVPAPVFPHGEMHLLYRYFRENYYRLKGWGHYLLGGIRYTHAEGVVLCPR